MATKKSWTYKKAGVDIVAGDALVDRIKNGFRPSAISRASFRFPRG
jgi:phosphoribosylaminoimidazole (AIR) synthetase